MTVRGGGTNPYSQPDHKISVFFTTSLQLIKSLPLVPDPMDWSGINFKTLRLSVWTLETESRAIKTLQKEKQEVIKAAEIESFDACKTKTLFGELEAGSTVDENFPAAILLSRKHFAGLAAY